MTATHRDAESSGPRDVESYERKHADARPGPVSRASARTVCPGEVTRSSAPENAT